LKKAGVLVCMNIISHYTCCHAVYLTLIYTETITEQNCKSIHHAFNIVLSAERIIDDTLRSMIFKLRDKK
jgi:hypothetical protein